MVEEELQMAFGDEDIESMSSFSELLIFLFLEDVKLLSLWTSEAAGLGSWAGDGGLGEGKPVGNMKKEILNQIANLLMLRSRLRTRYTPRFRSGKVQPHGSAYE